MSDKVIIHLWCCPRTLSTATMYSFAQRKDTIVFDEPLYSSYLRRYPNQTRPYKEEIFKAQQWNESLFIESLPNKFTTDKTIIVCKHIAKQVSIEELHECYHKYNNRNDIRVEHVFLIRDPLDIINSWSEKISVHGDGCSLESLCFITVVNLFSKLRRLTQRTPLVVDSNILKQYPQEILTQLCDKLSIPFDIAQLSWPAGPKPEIDGLV